MQGGERRTGGRDGESWLGPPAVKIAGDGPNPPWAGLATPSYPSIVTEPGFPISPLTWTGHPRICCARAIRGEQVRRDLRGGEAGGSRGQGHRQRSTGPRDGNRTRRRFPRNREIPPPRPSANASALFPRSPSPEKPARAVSIHRNQRKKIPRVQRIHLPHRELPRVSRQFEPLAGAGALPLGNGAGQPRHRRYATQRRAARLPDERHRRQGGAPCDLHANPSAPLGKKPQRSTSSLACTPIRASAGNNTSWR